MHDQTDEDEEKVVNKKRDWYQNKKKQYSTFFEELAPNEEIKKQQKPYDITISQVDQEVFNVSIPESIRIQNKRHATI